MLENPILLIGLSTIFASIPIAVWIYLFFSKGINHRKTIFLIFLFGCLTAPAMIGIQYLWNIFPQFNLAQFIEENISGQNKAFIATFILFGAMEEILKMYVVTLVDKKTLLINKINDALKYSIVSALGFSFIENIYYLYQFWPTISTGQLIGMYIFRSAFTTCAHIIFSGIFGYYYGIGKFSIDISKQKKIIGESDKIQKAISRVFNLPAEQAYQQKMVIKGLFIAIGMHAIYNYLLQFNIVIPVIIFVLGGYLYLKYLLKRKAGHLILRSDITERQRATIAKKDEEVVLDLMGLWFTEERYVDVIHICERLLERDPDNNVVKLFKARAIDAMDNKNIYKKVLGNILKTKEELSEKDRSIISKYTEEKEMLRKVKEKIKDQMSKEGKSFIDPESNQTSVEIKSLKKEDPKNNQVYNIKI